MSWFAKPAESVRAYDLDHEHTLHFRSELILRVAELLKLKRTARRTKKRRETVAKPIAAYNEAREHAAA